MNNSTIKPKKKICTECERSTYIFAHGLCKECYRRKNALKWALKESTREIPKVSKKGLKMRLDYNKVRRRYLNTHAFCEVCGNRATDVHHMRGRVGRLLTDAKNFLAVCRACHTKIEENPAWAKANDYSKSRLANEQNN